MLALASMRIRGGKHAEHFYTVPKKHFKILKLNKMAFSFKKTGNSFNKILKFTQETSSGLPSLDAFLCMQYNRF